MNTARSAEAGTTNAQPEADVCVTARAGLRAALAIPQRVSRESLGDLLSNTRPVNISLAEVFRARPE
jgi:hypothetical protein